MENPLTIDMEKTGTDSAVLRVGGRLDVDTYDELDAVFQDLIGHGLVHIEVDLADLEYISSAGFGIFIEAMATVQQYAGTLRFVHLSEKARSIFELLGALHDACEGE